MNKHDKASKRTKKQKISRASSVTKGARSSLHWGSIRAKLWENQIASLDRIDAYFNTAGWSGGALVQMPTGTGKTIIIAVGARLRAQSGGIVLVVSPSAALAEQLKSDLSSNVWSRLGVTSPWSDLDVTSLLRSEKGDIAGALARRKTKAQVLVGTLQALTNIRNEDDALYRQIADAACAVFVDEGHREPAPAWRDSVEGLDCPVVLFSATPYRNDLRAFNVDRDHVVYRSFKWAVAENLIRDVKFETLSGAPDAGAFALDAVRRFKRMERDGDILPDAKAILRFADEASILTAVAALEGNRAATSLGFVAVHENFTAGDAHRTQHIANLRSRPERLFLHQFKLSEGVDEPRCAVLFLHATFGNERQLVQQIGRCVRRVNPKGTPEPDAIVVTPPGSSAETSWKMYREFDAACEKNGTPPIFDEVQYGRLLRSLGMPAEYAGRKFRLSLPKELDEGREQPLDPVRKTLEETLARDVIVPRRCVVYNAISGSTFDEDVARVENQLREGDRLILASARPYPAERPMLHVVVCHKIQNAELFDRYSLLENTYTVTILHRRGDRLFLFDSGRLALTKEEPIAPEDLRKLLPERDTTRITMAATRNTDISPHAVRGREILTASLRDTPPTLTDFLGVLSRARGHMSVDGDRVGRYVGFFTGHLSDSRSAYIDAWEFSEWCTSIEKDLDSANEPAHVFRRYAQPVKPPASPEPRNILLDLSQFGTSFRNVETSQDLIIEDYCADVQSNSTGKHLEFPWEFKITIVPSDSAVAPYEVTCLLRYDSGGHFRVHSDDIVRFVSTVDGEAISALQAVDRAQSFRIVLGDGTEAYAYGQFYSVAPSTLGMRDVIDDLLISDNGLTDLLTEKGDTTPGTSWDKTSVFGYLDDCKANIPLRRFDQSGWTYVICEDLLTEVADFIAYKMNPPTVAFFHAKRPSKKHLLSASSLHEVLAQAIKNLDAIRIGGSGISEDHAEKWNDDWKIKDRRVKRIRKGGLTGAKHLANLKRLLGSATTQRHVCVVIAGGISRKRLIDELAKPKPDVVAIQAFLLLTAFYAEVSSVGVVPTVVCD